MIELNCEYLSIRCIWLYVLDMSCTRLRVTPYSIFTSMSRNSLLQTSAISGSYVTATGLEPTTTLFVNKHSIVCLNWQNYRPEFWVPIGTVHLAICSCHVTYPFQSESTLYICLNGKKLLTENRRHFWSLSDCNRTQSYNHLVRKRLLNHLVKVTKW